MPELNGKELYLKVRARHPAIKVLFMSGYPGDIIARHGLLEAQTHFVKKPFNEITLVSSVRSALDSPSP